MRLKTLFLGLMLGAIAAAGTAQAQEGGDPVVGEQLATTCMGCHAVEGARNAYPSYRVPKLGGQFAEYLVIALEAYKNGDREHPTMQAQAEGLSEQDMRDIAAYFAQQP